MDNFHISLADLDGFVQPQPANGPGFSEVINALAEDNWDFLFARPFPVIRVLLVDQSHAERVAATPLSQLVASDKVGDDDPVLVIAIGQQQALEIVAGCRYGNLATETIKLPTRNALGNPSDSHVTALMQAIFDLHVIAANDEATDVTIYPYLDWKHLPNTRQALEDCAKSGRLNVEYVAVA